jgi:hypothetical protein
VALPRKNNPHQQHDELRKKIPRKQRSAMSFSRQFPSDLRHIVRSRHLLPVSVVQADSCGSCRMLTIL